MLSISNLCLLCGLFVFMAGAFTFTKLITNPNAIDALILGIQISGSISYLWLSRYFRSRPAQVKSLEQG